MIRLFDDCETKVLPRLIPKLGTGALGIVSIISIISIISILAVIGSKTEMQAQSFNEYQVKAAFLYNLAKFVEWPPEAFADASSPIVIGVVGPDPFEGALEDATNNKSVCGRRIVIKQFKVGQDVRACHLLFVGVTEKKELTAVMLGLRQASVLTVGDMESFNRQGGVIRFLQEGNKLRFEINLAAAERARLKISSKLLSLAKIAK